MIRRVNIKTSSKVDIREVTSIIRQTIAGSGIDSGLCCVYVPHTTAGVTINEHADPDVIEDIKAHLEIMVPEKEGYRHREGNSPAHIKATLIGSSVNVIIERGEPMLGTWQGVFFCEFDGPRSRNLIIKIIADGE